MSVNLTAPLNALGYGVVGTNLALALEAAGKSPALWPIGRVELSGRTASAANAAALRTMLDRQASYDPDAPSLRVWHQFDLAQHVGRGLHCALPFFELDRFRPNELHHLKSQDVVFAAGLWAANVLVDNGVEPHRVQRAVLGVDTDVFRLPLAGTESRFSSTVFMNVGKWEVRKGHDVLVEAFNKAFGPADDVRLVMHCHNPCFQDADKGRAYNAEWTRLYKTSPLGDKITVTDSRIDLDGLVAMMWVADCGVFPSRAEGWNLPLVEMLATGRHVIATDYSAHTEFCNRENSLRVAVDRLEEAHDGVWFRADDPAWAGRPGRWAHLGEAQIDQLVEHMRSIHRRKQEGLLGLNRAGVEHVRSLFTWAETVKDICSVLEV